MAYHGLAINQDGSLDPCCQYTRPPASNGMMYWDHHEFSSHVRQKMHEDWQQGIAHQGCQKCYREEDLGWTSLRQHAIQWYGVDNTDQIYDLELRLGNLCNLKCIMCSPGASSSIATERYVHRTEFGRIGLDLQKPWMLSSWWEDSRFFQVLDHVLPQCKRINITGGEPFLIPQVAEILQRLPESATVSFNTNLSGVPHKILTGLQRLPKVSIMISLEGTGTMNDYLRYPSKWQDIVHNLQILKRDVPHAELGVNHTFQHASVYSLPALAKMCVEHDLTLQMTTVQGMPWLTLNSVPVTDLDQMRVWARHSSDLDPKSQRFVVNACDAAHFDHDLYLRYRDYVNTLDQVRGTSYDSIFCPAVPS